MLAISFLFSIVVTARNPVSITARPANILIEKGENLQFINFDFKINNSSTDTLTITKIRVSVYDAKNQLLQQRFIDNNGTAPSINTIPNRILNGVSTELVFNPFEIFAADLPIHSLVYHWTFENNNGNEEEVSVTTYPKDFKQTQSLSFPLKAKVLVYDAHDLYAHHRRFNYEFSPIKALGISANFMRYAYDFVMLNDSNQQFKNKGETASDYYGFAQPVYAVGAGKIIYASNKHKDDKQFNVPALAENPLELYGNCIAIEHSDGEVSIYGHLKENSLMVKVGDIVKGQQAIAQIGISGSSFFPHLHFEMRTGILSSSEGLPSYFSNIYLIQGTIKKKSLSGLAETGSIVAAQ